MKLKLVYFIKLFLIVALAACMMASIGAAINAPVLFAALYIAGVTLIRFLWSSACKNEKSMRRRRVRVCTLPTGMKRAA